METLHQLLSRSEHSPGHYKKLVPGYVYSCLNERFLIRPYQEEAFGRFVYHLEEYSRKKNTAPVHLLYHMATGSGKTLIMAGLILYLYAKGYRHFLFFVNSANIIDKTKDNFLNRASSKYLFADLVSIGGYSIRIKEADNFEGTAGDDITVVFATVQGLHSRLNTPGENSITYEDFEDKKIVLISDEAHHINAETKKGKTLYSDEVLSWEGTVNRLFRANQYNILLEFTATAALSLPGIASKYADKLIYDYSLRQFRNDGYSKEVKVMQADRPAISRALIAVILSQYRKKLFEKYGKRIKPVILFKSRTIQQSHEFRNKFSEMIRNLDTDEIVKLSNDTSNIPLTTAFRYFRSHGISAENLLRELREDLAEDKLISVNSREESEQKQIAVNSLEEEGNHYRAIFAVDKLNEGWDVLNLFDIVRLHEGKTTGTSKTTMSEAQLIGRGARYCPFRLTEGQHYAERKFDNDPEHELKICEELWYHSIYDPPYIRELSAAMEESGIRAGSAEVKSYPSREPKSNDTKEDVITRLRKLVGKQLEINIYTEKTNTGILFSSGETLPESKTTHEHKLSAVHPVIARKAMSRLPFYRFASLKKIFPGVNSALEFVYSDKYLGTIRFKITGIQQSSLLTPEQQLSAVTGALQKIATTLSGF
ncbi:MAG: DEAD/DEAH box helicase family protein [Chitinophagaceae bacterium]|nr:DEAD/DEAH box helicase family protein [Chitinophagaceae bacterium]